MHAYIHTYANTHAYTHTYLATHKHIYIHSGPDIFEFFKCKEFPQYMQELKISELDISKKKLNIDGHLVSTLGSCGGLERTDF